MQHKLLAVGRQVLRQTLEGVDRDNSSQLFPVEIINIFVCNDEVSFLGPVVFVPLLELAAHQHFFVGCGKTK